MERFFLRIYDFFAGGRRWLAFLIPLVLLAGFWVATDDFPYIFGIDLGAFINGKVPDGIRKHVFGKSSFPPLSLEFDIAFRPDDEEGFYLVNLVEVPEIVVATIEDIVSILLVRYLRYHFAVMH